MAKNRKLLLESARELLTQRNFESVTIREICEHAGVANSTFYYHFKTKEELMDSLRAQDDRPLRTELLELVKESNLMEQVLAVCLMRTTRAERYGCSITAQYYKSVIIRENDCDGLAEDHRNEEETALALISRAQQEGLISSDKDAKALIVAAIRLTRCVIFDWCAAGGSFDLRAEARRMLLLLFGIEE